MFIWQIIMSIKFSCMHLEHMATVLRQTRTLMIRESLVQTLVLGKLLILHCYCFASNGHLVKSEWYRQILVSDN